MTFRESFANRLVSARKAAGLTQAELGMMVGKTSVAVCYWEKCKRIPSIEVASLLAQALHMSLDDLVPRAELMLPPVDERQQTIDFDALVSSGVEVIG